MSTRFPSLADSAYRRFITPSKAGFSVDSRSPFEAVMDSVVRRLPRLCSPHTIHVLTGLIAHAGRTGITANLKSALIAVWKALLVVVETPAHSQAS